MSRELDPPPAAGPLRRALDDVYPRPVVPLHVAVARGEPGGPAAVEVAGDAQGLEKYFRHHDRAAQVQHHATVVQVRQTPRQPLEVAVARGADDGAVRRGVLVNDLRTERGVDRHGDVPLGTGDEYGRGAPGEIGAAAHGAGERLAGAPSSGGSRREGGIHVASRFLRHAEAAVT